MRLLQIAESLGLTPEELARQVEELNGSLLGRALPPFPAEEVFRAWVAKWQPRLGLADWQLTLRLVDPRELRPDSTAEIARNVEHKTAEIQISKDERSADYINPGAHDWEEVTVHEMLHCVLDFPCLEKLSYSDPFQKTLYEQRINALARALILADRSPGTDRAES